MKIAIIGCGNYARFALQRITGNSINDDHIDLKEMVKKIFLVDIIANALKEKCLEFKIPEDQAYMHIEDLPDVDCAIIATPTDTHYTAAKPFLSKTTPLFITKPLDSDLTKAREIAKYTHDRITMTGSNIVMHPAIIFALDYINEHKIDINHVNINWFKERGPRTHNIEGIIEEEGPHVLEILHKINPKDPSITSLVKKSGDIIIDPPRIYPKVNYKEKVYGKKSIIKELYGILSYPDMTAQVNMSFNNGRKQRTIEIVGSTQKIFDSVTIYIDITDDPKNNAPHVSNGVHIYRGLTGNRDGTNNHIMKKFPYYDSIGMQISNFLKSVKTGKNTGTTFSEYLKIEKRLEKIK